MESDTEPEANVTVGDEEEAVDSLYVVAPGGQEAAMIVAQMASAGWRCVNVEPAELLTAIQKNTLGAAILTTAALQILDHDALKKVLADQPPWSDCPLILLSTRGYVPHTSRRSLEGFGNVTVLERPVLPSTVATAVATALRTRARQRETEAYIRQREDADASLRSLAASLEARVAARTIQLTDALAEREAADERLLVSEERYRLTVELSAQTPWTASPDLEILTYGKAAQDSNEPNPTRDFRSYQWLDYIHPNERQMVEQAWRFATRSSQPLDVSFTMRMPDGDYAWYRARANPKLDGTGKLERWYGTMENIDQQRRDAQRFSQLQSELIHVSRLSAMGTMASTLAHELNQPLTAIANYIRGGRRMLSALDLPSASAIDTVFGKAEGASMRAGEILRSLRAMVMLTPADHQVEDAVSVVREAGDLALIDAALRSISVTFALGETQVPIRVDRVQIQQVLINLIRNAIEALHACETREIMISITTSAENCTIQVRDSGHGFTPEVEAKLFTPFTSTKQDGMGIGLSISRTIIEAHNGTITAENVEGGGAVFSIVLPLSLSPP